MNILSVPQQLFKQSSHYKASMAFTLVELVVVMVVLSILAAGSVKFISQSAQGLVDSAERQSLASTANIAIERVLRQVRRALPNSVRTFDDGGNSCIELVPILYRSEYLSVPTASTETDFEAIAFADAVGGESGFVAVYPISQHSIYGTDPATVRSVSTNTASASAVGIPSANLQTLTFSSSSNYRFPTDSPGKRFFLISEPISFCEDASGRLWRYQNYGFHPDSRSSLPTSGVNRILIADSLEANSLSFNIAPPQLQRNAVVRMNLVIVSSSSNADIINISQAVQLRNVP
ncbi:MAG: MSHA biogenesis protein MshO [Oleispira sp.]|jgi:MSHA biogenesis protein MshO